MKKKFKYIVYTYNFNDKVGGIMVLHKLCALLNDLGYDSFLYRPSRMHQLFKVLESLFIFFAFWHKAFLNYSFLNKEINAIRQSRNIRTCHGLTTPFYSGKIDKNCIVIYPEVIEGNPYKAKNVVRWFLHKPGYFTGRVVYGQNELYFFYKSAFNDPLINPNSDNCLTVKMLRSDIFYQTNFGDRSGSCYALRKGKNKKIEHKLENSILIDNLSQVEIAKVFNKCETFISYDTQSFYSTLAVLCGCRSVVIPDNGVGIEEWLSDPSERFGIAYGFENMDEAEKTRHLLLKKLSASEEYSLQSVRNFVKKCETFF